MDVRPLSGNAVVTAFPICVNATTLGTSDPVLRDFEANITGGSSIDPLVPGKEGQQLLHPVWVWRDLEIDVLAVDWVLPPVIEKREQRQLHPVAATGPSEASIGSYVLDATEDGGDSIDILEIIAETGDEIAFVQAASEIDWPQRPATDFARAVRSALAAGAHLLARKLADHGHRLYPNQEELAKMAHILAPPRVVRTDIPPALSLQANQEWLRVHGDKYRGQWVALRDGILLAAAATARQLRACLESTGGVLITKVF